MCTYLDCSFQMKKAFLLFKISKIISRTLLWKVNVTFLTMNPCILYLGIPFTSLLSSLYKDKVFTKIPPSGRGQESQMCFFSIEKLIPMNKSVKWRTVPDTWTLLYSTIFNYVMVFEWYGKEFLFLSFCFSHFSIFKYIYLYGRDDTNYL